MTYAPEKHHRRSIRLGGYDYGQAGAYFVSICTQNRDCMFGEIANGEMRLNPSGQIVREEWLRTSVVRPDVELDAFVIMPNHVHGIVCFIEDGRGTARRAPTVERFGHPVRGSLPTIVRAFKSAATKRINEIRRSPGTLVWQRNYYEHVIRDGDELDRVRKYIEDNPGMWEMDGENPVAQKTKDKEAWLR